MGEVTLITGGIRCGKSSFAIQRALSIDPRPCFIATAEALDNEMRLRIEKHRAERMDRFQIIEEPLDLASAVAKIPAGSRAAVIDCLTVWLGNLFYHYPDTSEAMHAHLDRFESALGKGAAELFIVTNEVGWGIVPADAISRRYQEIAGWLNRRIAAKADRVYLCVCGIPTVIKETCA